MRSNVPAESKLLETREGKFSIVLHTLINSLYRKMDIQMMDVVHRGEILREAEKLRTEDLVSCYLKSFKKILKK